jgi:ABC-type multidrug transport system permease subunit
VTVAVAVAVAVAISPLSMCQRWFAGFLRQATRTVAAAMFVSLSLLHDAEICSDFCAQVYVLLGTQLGG